MTKFLRRWQEARAMRALTCWWEKNPDAFADFDTFAKAREV